MTTTQTYRILEADDIAAYLRERGHADGEHLTVREVSDGNMNRVFIATGPTHSLAVKQALPGCASPAPPGP